MLLEKKSTYKNFYNRISASLFTLRDENLYLQCQLTNEANMSILSISGKRWDVTVRDTNLSLMERIYKAKGLESEEDRHSFISTDPRELLHDPFLMHDMEKACIRLEKAIADKERIVIFGDYDTDGVTATAVLVRTLKKLGGEVSYRIPHRLKDGYSLKNYFLDELKELDVRVLVTVDNGIAAAKEIAYANDLGMDIIVTDHHTPPPRDELPKAHAIINPKIEDCPYPFKELSGSAVAMKLCIALVTRNLPESSEREDFLEILYQIAGVGIVADCMPIIGENRAIVKIALRSLKERPVKGIFALLTVAGVSLEEMTARTIGFNIGPRLNAAGRMDSAYDALHLFLNSSESVHDIAKRLDILNGERRAMTEIFTEEAKAMVDPNAPLVIVASPNWNPGINGLVASRLVDHTTKPVMVLSEQENVFVASCRSIPSFGMVDALRSVSDLLEHFGGHHAAAGFSIKKEHLPAFTERMYAYASEQLTEADYTPALRIDTVAVPEDITLQVIDDLATLEPFGIANPKPLFLLENITVSDAKQVGNDKSHLSLQLGGVRGIAFRMGKHQSEILKSPVDIVCTFERNVWNNNVYPQFLVEDMRF